MTGMSRTPTPAELRHAERNLPRYTSYPTALAFRPIAANADARGWIGRTQAHEPISAYVHVPFCRRLCWYCGCHTTVVHDYERIGAFVDVIRREIDLAAEALGPHAGLAHLHFGGGSPNALSPEHFVALSAQLKARLSIRPEAELAVELDPGRLARPFIAALGEAGVTRASLGVQTFDPAVQAKVNRVQPFDQVAAAVEGLRAAGVAGLNFDLMYGLPLQDETSVARSAERAVELAPDRISVFGYAHVPWMKKHQQLVEEADLADAAGRWAQAEAADAVLTAAGYVRVGLDHYARPGDGLARAAAEGRLRRNFQGYTDDPAPVLVPFGPSAIGRFRQGFVQNAAADAWREAVGRGEAPLSRQLAITREDRLRADVIERLMCDLAVDVGAVCAAHGYAPDALDAEIAVAAALAKDGLCAVSGRQMRVPEGARRLVRAAAACFDARLPAAQARHSRAV
jgi:oxygen-independent coproporphyrinogen-3 oxidase